MTKSRGIIEAKKSRNKAIYEDRVNKKLTYGQLTRKYKMKYRSNVWYILSKFDCNKKESSN